MPFRDGGSGLTEYYTVEPENGSFKFDSKKVKRRLANHRRRAREYGRKSEIITVEDIKNIIIEQDYRCFYSHDPLDGKWEIEHFKELANGGDNILSNLVVVSRHYNRSKGARGLDYLVDNEEAENSRREHHENNWESEHQLSYMSYQWNQYYRDHDEPEIYVDWMQAYDEHRSLRDVDSNNRRTDISEEDLLDWLL